MVKLPPKDMPFSAQPLYVVEHVVEKNHTISISNSSRTKTISLANIESINVPIDANDVNCYLQLIMRN